MKEGHLIKLLFDTTFEVFFTLIILSNAIFIGIETQRRDKLRRLFSGLGRLWGSGGAFWDLHLSQML